MKALEECFDEFLSDAAPLDKEPLYRQHRDELWEYLHDGSGPNRPGDIPDEEYFSRAQE
ncbi:hypothetical protein J4439_02770 [Candidatus Woesearchaeota archaeon]|nr:hypothetical protein [Candidatus Woesearchaeota archaeon]